MELDINILRGLSTIFVMIGFLGVCVWAYSGKRKAGFEEAAQIPFKDSPFMEGSFDDEQR